MSYGKTALFFLFVFIVVVDYFVELAALCYFMLIVFDILSVDSTVATINWMILWTSLLLLLRSVFNSCVQPSFDGYF